MNADRIPDGATRMLLAVVKASEARGFCSMQAAADVYGCNKATAYALLLRLRGAGLVAWEPGRKFTLRPLVRPVGWAA